MSRSRFAGAAALCVLLLTTGASRAQSAADIATARELFKEGAQLVEQGRWEEARDRYQRSLALKRAAITLYSLGVALQGGGHLVEALETFRAFLAEPPAPVTQPWIERARIAVADLEKRVASLEIAVAPAGLPGLVVRVDGQAIPVIVLDRRRLIDPGKHEIVASAPGYREARASAVVAEGGAGKIALVLEPAPLAVMPAPAGPPVAPVPPGAPPAPIDPRRDPAPAPDRTVPLALIGGGAGVLGIGIAVGAVGIAQANSAPTRDGPEAKHARVKMLAGDIVGGVGAAAGAAGLIVLLVQRAAPRPAAAPRPGAAGAARVDAWIAGCEAGVQVRF